MYLSEIGKLDANPGKKERNNYDLNTKNKDGHDTKCQHTFNCRWRLISPFVDIFSWLASRCISAYSSAQCLVKFLENCDFR